MLIYIRPIVLVIHILLGITWVGGILFVGWGVYPSVKKMKIFDQRFYLTSMMNHTHHLFSLAGVGVIFTGVLLGTLLGPIKTWDFLLTSTYGILFLTALVIGILTLIWGIFISYPSTMRMLNNDQVWQDAENGHIAPLKKSMRKMTVIAGVEVIGFIVLVTIMVLI